MLALLESSSRIDPQSPLRWTRKSLRVLADELMATGHAISHVVAGRLLMSQGCSLQASAKVIKGNQSPDRNPQFEHINASVATAIAAGRPVISVNTKKTELVGQCKNAGREWHPAGVPEQVQVHDVVDSEAESFSSMTGQRVKGRPIQAHKRSHSPGYDGYLKRPAGVFRRDKRA